MSCDLINGPSSYLQFHCRGSISNIPRVAGKGKKSADARDGCAVESFHRTLNIDGGRYAGG